MSNCTICQKTGLRYLMHNKLVCMECDELTFDIEIEEDALELADEQSVVAKRERSLPPSLRTKRAKVTK